MLRLISLFSFSLSFSLSLFQRLLFPPFFSALQILQMNEANKILGYNATQPYQNTVDDNRGYVDTHVHSYYPVTCTNSFVTIEEHHVTEDILIFRPSTI